MDRGQSLIIPPSFDGTNYAYDDTNYAYWKVRMRAFLQSLDEKVWQAVEIGWTKQKEAPADWDDVKIKAANFNSRALNALFIAVMNEEFKKISSTETTKKAWTILQTTYEGTKVVKDSKFLSQFSFYVMFCLTCFYLFVFSFALFCFFLK